MIIRIFNFFEGISFQKILTTIYNLLLKKMSEMGLEPTQISPYAPETYVSTIPPLRQNLYLNFTTEIKNKTPGPNDGQTRHSARGHGYDDRIIILTLLSLLFLLHALQSFLLTPPAKPCCQQALFPANLCQGFLLPCSWSSRLLQQYPCHGKC